MRILLTIALLSTLLGLCLGSQAENTKRTEIHSRGDLELGNFTIGENTYYYGNNQQFSVKDGYIMVCEDKGARHVAFETEQEWLDMNDYLLSKGYYGDRFWSSGEKVHADGSFMWRSTNTTLNYEGGWFFGEPNDKNTEDNAVCVYFVPGFGLFDNLCVPEFTILCEF